MEGTNTLMNAVTEGISTVISWVGDVVTALTTGELAPLLSLLAVGIAISGFAFTIKAIRSITWGA